MWQRAGPNRVQQDGTSSAKMRYTQLRTAALELLGSGQSPEQALQLAYIILRKMSGDPPGPPEAAPPEGVSHS
jgi:hypothetical protein